MMLTFYVVCLHANFNDSMQHVITMLLEKNSLMSEQNNIEHSTIKR